MGIKISRIHTTKPNILYIITHDQGAAASCYAEYSPCASQKMVTPNIDALAQKGAILTKHFGTAPQCSPARGSLMTGKFPHVNGLIGLTHRGFQYNDPSKTVVNHFRKNGYNTKLIGFQHEHRGNLNEVGYEEIGPKPGKNCFSLLDDVKKSLNTMKENHEKGTPTWLSVGVHEVHLRWEKFIKRKERFKPKDVDVPGFLPDTQRIRKHIGALYGSLKLYDTFLGEILKTVDELGLRENTIIIVTTDHGIAHPRAKGTMYDPGDHDLMVWSYPKLIPQGKKVNSLLSSIDFASTVCDMCGIEIHEEFMGKSYKPLLTSEKKEENDEINEYIFTELTYHDIYNPQRAIRSKRYKYIRHYAPEIPLSESLPKDIKHATSYKDWVKFGTNTQRDEEEFYDLIEDPLEEYNILKNEPNHPIYLKMKADLEQKLEKTNDKIIIGHYPAPKNASFDNSDVYGYLKQ